MSPLRRASTSSRSLVVEPNRCRKGSFVNDASPTLLSYLFAIVSLVLECDVHKRQLLPSCKFSGRQAPNVRKHFPLTISHRIPPAVSAVTHRHI
jgi:hypothetical protein